MNTHSLFSKVELEMVYRIDFTVNAKRVESSSLKIFVFGAEEDMSVHVDAIPDFLSLLVAYIIAKMVLKYISQQIKPV